MTAVEGGTEGDKAGKAYWDEAWETAPLAPQVDVESRRPDDYVKRQYHQLFERVLGPAAGRSLLEVGCARSAWLPYFARRGYDITGLDYSERGLALTRRQLDDAGVDGQLVLADFFAPPVELRGRFDVLVSFGVVEHFEHTAECLSALAAFLRPGGLAITFIPNMTGAPGWVQQRINRPVYDVHVPLDREALAAAHRDAKLEVVECEYLLPVNPGVLNLAGLPERTPAWWAKRVGIAVLVRVARLAWRLHERTGRTRTSRLLSPYVVCVARRPE